eukprot:547994_1
MSSHRTCDWNEQFNGSFFEFAVFLPIIIFLQITLLIHTIYNEFIKHGNYSKNKTERLLKILFLMMQLTGLYWAVEDMCRFVIDPFTHIFRQNVLCELSAISPKFISFLYYAIFLLFILFRLKISFKGSYFEISQRNLYLLSLFIIIPAIILPILLTIYLNTPCIWDWKPIDLNLKDPLTFCSFYGGSKVNTVILAGMAWVAIANITIGIIFGVKLKNVLNLHQISSSDEQCEQKRHKMFKMKSLIVKISILTIIGSLSSLLSYLLWILTNKWFNFGAVFLYLDLFTNCLCSGLMFSSNDKYYKKLCRVCIVLLLIKLDKGYDHTKQDEIKQRENKVSRYLQRISRITSISAGDTLEMHHNVNTSNTLNTPNTPSIV